ncbi:MAG TPA: flavoprotein [Planctomycetaceae bacterium]|nr:flavoprotein [Planctomycetaceae bacterium]
MRILITSGPTRQYLDPVRYLSNASSGRMGAALALAVLERGGMPVVVSGPVGIDYPEGAEVHRVETTVEMLEAARSLFGECDGVIGAAAPCDFQPETVAREKIAKHPDRTPYRLQLVETPDILAELAKTKRADQWIIAFALETEDSYRHAVEKIRKKGADLVVLNGPASIDAVTTDVSLIDSRGRIRAELHDTKEQVARAILRHIAAFDACRTNVD